MGADREHIGKKQEMNESKSVLKSINPIYYFATNDKNVNDEVSKQLYTPQLYQ